MHHVIAGRYELRFRRSRGGTAQVWEALDQRLRRRVAAKLLTGDAVDDAARARFIREGVTATRFAHPNTVSVHDIGTESGTSYLVMELVDGPTLDEVLLQRGILDPVEAVAVADQLLAALDAGHRAGFVHCDIKPSNILLSRWPDSGWMVKLADFGAARKMDEPVRQGEQFALTPRYASPELAAGRPPTPEADLYTVGVVLFEMLSGGLPFVGDTPLATIAAHRDAPVPSLGARRPELPPALAVVVERALAKTPEARGGCAAAMREALIRALHERPH